jgi:hypothetical protein
MNIPFFAYLRIFAFWTSYRVGGPNFQPTTSGYQQLWHHGTIYMVPLAPCREKILSVEVILFTEFPLVWKFFEVCSSLRLT